jgi:metal-responsive CopG/Arc/MetJ family transcriptional regulator
MARKKPGPPPTGKGELIGVRIQPDQMKKLDEWISDQDDRPSRPEAIRRLVDQALKGKRKR